MRTMEAVFVWCAKWLFFLLAVLCGVQNLYMVLWSGEHGAVLYYAAAIVFWAEFRRLDR